MSDRRCDLARFQLLVARFGLGAEGATDMNLRSNLIAIALVWVDSENGHPSTVLPSLKHISVMDLTLSVSKGME